MERLVAFLYTDDYASRAKIEFDIDHWRAIGNFTKLGNNAGTADAHDTELMVHAKVYIIADKFDVQDLKECACEKFEETLGKGVGLFVNFTALLQKVYENTNASDTDLRQLCMKFAATHFKGLIDRGEVFDFCKEDGDFTATFLREIAHIDDDVGKAVRKGRMSIVRLQCPYCGSPEVNAGGEWRYVCSNCHYSF